LATETPAASGVGGADESTWFTFAVPTDALAAGTNLLAVEVHQSSGTSSDITFDLMLEIQRPADLTPITLHETTHVKARVLSGGQWSALNEARFTVSE
jgi:hypothetical protein